MAQHRKPQQSLDHSFTQFEIKKFLHLLWFEEKSIIRIIIVLIGYSSNHILSDRINQSILSKYSRERKRKEEKGEYVQNTFALEEHLQRFADCAKMRKAAARTKVFHEQHFLPASLLWNRASLHFVTEKFEIGAKCLLPSRGIFFASKQRWNHSLERRNKRYRNFSSPRSSDFSRYHESRIRYRFIVFIVNPCLAY